MDLRYELPLSWRERHDESAVTSDWRAHLERVLAAAAELGFRKPSLRIPDAAFQALPMPAYEPWMTGTLVYSHVFWEHDAVGLREAAAS